MRALITSPDGRILTEIPECQISSPHEVKIQIHRAALCRTDLYVENGAIPTTPGTIMGHEAAGSVVACGERVSGLSIGDRVVIDPVLPCGSCLECQKGDSHHCADSRFLGIDEAGAFADYLVVSESQLRRIPDALSFDLAVYAEPIAATRAILQSSIQPDDDVLIFGSGRIAKLTEQILRSAGCENVTVSTNPEDRQFHTIIEAADSGEHIAQALAALIPGGRLVLKSRHPESLALPLLETIKRRVRIEAVYYSPFDEALDYLVEHQTFFASLLGNCWPLESYQEAFAEATASESLKTLFRLR